MAYNPYYYPQDQLAQLRAPYQAPPTQSSMIFVQGEAAAKAYLVAPGASVLLMDSESSRFFIKSCDQSGMPTMRVFSYSEITNSSQTGYVTREEFNALAARIDAMNGGENDGKPAV